jgi:hypothetical protein
LGTLPDNAISGINFADLVEKPEAALVEQIGLTHILAIIKEFGIPGLILLLWYLTMKSTNAALDAYRDDTNKILGAYKEDVQAMRQMYENNIMLVKSYQALCGDLKDIVILNSKGFQALDDSIKRKCAALREG